MTLAAASVMHESKLELLLLPRLTSDLAISVEITFIIIFFIPSAHVSSHSHRS